MEKQPEEEGWDDYVKSLSSGKTYRIEIAWKSAMDTGFWSWEVYRPLDLEPLASGTSYYRWFGLWRAKHWCKQHAAGKLRIPDDGSRTLYFDA